MKDEKTPLSCCEKCCFRFNNCNLQILNFIDICLGGASIYVAVYLYTKLKDNFIDSNTGWLAWCLIIIGMLLLLVSLLSFCAVTSKCRCAISPAKYLCLLLSALCFATGIAAIALHNKVFNYLNDNGDEIGLSTSDINEIKQYYDIVSYTLLGMCILELIRFKLSQGFITNARRIDGEFDNLLSNDYIAWDEKINTNKVAREEKYKNLKEYYREKYKNNDTTEEQVDQKSLSNSWNM
jgi:hypothetical protein